ncbi:acetyl-CoA carboxylase, carboxyltransferase subunit beta [Sandarakinorhabdus oryzae]|uniref:acetyl-CoA carboxylase, carboxyltransferase subunit beta n=1 Tax=Sandarakinorhabdus oryzae TaxID=2675220 RepID=UPI0012E26780|nr:acetyl-CoA carboxylase, carboxyltransferase subunit beta [Sandarakinorhabdus oryzae]
MSWITRTRQQLTGFLARRDTPDNLWTKCKNCGQMVYTKEWEDNASVCPRCDHHDRIGPKARFTQLFDGDYKVLPAAKVAEDPLKFKDQKKYTDRLKQARTATGEPEAMMIADGQIMGQRAIVGVQDFAFMGGSMGMGVGEAFLAGVDAALAANAPYIVFTAAGGARMQEGILSLMQMPRSTVGIQQLNEAGLPYIVVLTDPTTGGVTASYAMLGDIQIAEPNALIGFAGQRVIEQTIREKLPEGFQRAEYLLEHGMLDMVVHRRDLKETLGRLITLLMARRPRDTAAA